MPAAARKEKPDYNPAMFRWARERRGQSIEEVAKRLNQAPERLDAWEVGRESPTVAQARALASVLERSFIEFFLQEPLEGKPSELVPDFRAHRGAEVEANHFGLQEIQRWAEAQRANALDLFEEIGETPPEFPKHLYDIAFQNVDACADATREAMDFPIEAQLAMKVAERVQLPSILRKKIEGMGVLTLKQSDLQKHHARGMCIVQFPLPIIVFGSEAPTAQVFTLAHELAHVIIQQSGIIAPLSYTASQKKGHSEAWCDQFAASFLMPARIVERFAGDRPKVAPSEIADSVIDSLAGILKVSPHAMLIRLVHLGYVRESFYWERKKAQYEAAEAEYQGFGRALFYGTRYRNTLGDLYTGLVLEAWAAGRITNHNAAQYMGIKNMRHLYDIREHTGV